MASLDAYLSKRDFRATPEPSHGDAPPSLALRYSMQKHDATRLHWDLRLEWDGVLLSWAVTRGPSLDPGDKRLAVRTEDHPLSYLEFEGTIPKDSYGAGTVMLWDVGHWQPVIPVARGLKKGHLHFRLHGRRMTGGWHLVRMKGRKTGDGKRENWLLVKEDDEAAHLSDPVGRYLMSVSTGRDLAGIAGDAEPSARARTGKAPRYRQPQLATLDDTVSVQDTRWHELKFDGYRALVSIGKGRTRIFTRNGHDWTDKFGPLIPAFEDLPADSALIDGEIVAGAGLQGFSALQKAITYGGPFTFYAFDLLEMDGASVAARPLSERRAALEALLRDAPPLGLIQLSPIIEGDPTEAFEAICAAGGEGLISKRIDAAYRGGRSRHWLKVKCERRESFRIIGYQASDKRGRPFASLLLASEDPGGELMFRGRVGTGFDSDTLDELSKAFAKRTRKTAPVEVPETERRDVTWLTPDLVAEVRYAEETAEGRLRHAVWLGLRDPADRGTLTVTAPPKSDAADRPTVAGIGISSADRVVFPKPKTTKLGVAEYYSEVADRLLGYSADRPLSLVRLPEGLGGERFFQKHIGKGWPDALGTVDIVEADGDPDTYMFAGTAAALVAAAQMGTIEMHIWPARRDRLDRPDRLVFDLDPDEGLSFAKVRSAAVDIRQFLSDLGLDSWPMVTGGKGIHVVVDLRRTIGWDTLKLFARGVAEVCAAREPDRFTTSLSKDKRKGRIFIDYLRNERGATAIAPFSLRARPGAPVAVPVTWDELGGLRRANTFGLRKALERDWPERPSLQTLSDRTVNALQAAADH